MSQYEQGVPQSAQYQEQTTNPLNPPPQANNNSNYQPHLQSDYPPTEHTSDGGSSPPPRQAYAIPRRQPSYAQAPGPQTEYQAQNMQGMYYAPPQARYPNDWQNQIFECLTPGELCVNTVFCPCIIFGRTAARVQDSTLSNYDTVNHDCFIWGVSSLCCLQWIYQMVKRREIRNTFALKGDEVEDCLMSSCCACCALVQQEKEVVGRQRAMGSGPRHQAEMGNQGYVPPEGMAMRNGARV